LLRPLPAEVFETGVSLRPRVALLESPDCK